MTRRLFLNRAAALAAVLVACGQLSMARQTAPAPAPPGAATFTKDIAPIVFRHCAPCHRPEGSGPFPLLTYDDVRRRADQIVAVTGKRVMPPWKPEPGFGTFVGERRLTGDEI